MKIHTRFSDSSCTDSCMLGSCCSCLLEFLVGLGCSFYSCGVLELFVGGYCVFGLCVSNGVKKQKHHSLCTFSTHSFSCLLSFPVLLLSPLFIPLLLFHRHMSPILGRRCTDACHNSLQRRHSCTSEKIAHACHFCAVERLVVPLEACSHWLRNAASSNNHGGPVLNFQASRISAPRSLP